MLHLLNYRTIHTIYFWNGTSDALFATRNFH